MNSINGDPNGNDLFIVIALSLAAAVGVFFSVVGFIAWLEGVIYG